MYNKVIQLYAYIYAAAAAAKLLHSCLTLCDPVDGSPPGSPVPGILQARTLEWVAISFSNAYIDTSIYLSISIYMYTHTHTYIYINIFTHTHTHTHNIVRVSNRINRLATEA